MALIQCKECKKEVSSDAKTCPHCGVKDPGVTFGAKIGGVIVLVVIIAVIVAFCDGDGGKEKSAPETPKQAEVAKPTMDMTIEAFEPRFVAEMAALKWKGKINLAPAFEEQKGFFAQAELGKGTIVQVEARNEQQRIGSVTVLYEDIDHALPAIYAAAAVVNPSLSAEENRQAIDGMIAKIRDEHSRKGLKQQVGEMSFELMMVGVLLFRATPL